MIHRLPTNCRQKIFHLWARLHTDSTINVVISLNRAELCKSVVFLHRQSILTMHMNDSQTAGKLPAKLFHSWARLNTDATINVVISLNRAELCESVDFLHRQSILTMHVNDSQTVDELPTKIISFVGEAAMDATINVVISHKRAELCERVVVLQRQSILTLHDS